MFESRWNCDRSTSHIVPSRLALEFSILTHERISLFDIFDKLMTRPVEYLEQDVEEVALRKIRCGSAVKM